MEDESLDPEKGRKRAAERQNKSKKPLDPELELGAWRIDTCVAKK